MKKLLNFFSLCVLVMGVSGSPRAGSEEPCDKINEALSAMREANTLNAKNGNDDVELNRYMKHLPHLIGVLQGVYTRNGCSTQAVEDLCNDNDLTTVIGGMSSRHGLAEMEYDLYLYKDKLTRDNPLRKKAAACYAKIKKALEELTLVRRNCLSQNKR